MNNRLTRYYFSLPAKWVPRAEGLILSVSEALILRTREGHLRATPRMVGLASYRAPGPRSCYATMLVPVSYLQSGFGQEGPADAQ